MSSCVRPLLCGLWIGVASAVAMAGDPTCNATVAIGSASIAPGSSGNAIQVSLTNNQPVNGLQMDVNEANAGSAVLVPTACNSLVNGMECSFNDLGTATRIVFLDLTGSTTIPPGSVQPVLEIVYSADPQASGVVGLDPGGVLVADQNNQSCPVSTSSGEVSFVNTPPVLAPIGDRQVDEGQQLSISLSASDVDQDGLTLSQTGLPAFCDFSPRGPTGNISCSPGFDDAGSYPVTVTVTDDGVPPQSDSETFTITVVEFDRPPVLDPIGDRTVDEGQALTIPLSATDPDTLDTLALSQSGLPGFCTFTSEGAMGSIDCSPGFDDAGDYPVTVTVTDSGELTDDETFTLTVHDINRPPVLQPIGDRTVAEGQQIVIPLSASDPDVQDTVAFSATGLPGFCSLSSDKGAWSIDCAPDFRDKGSYPVTVIASDDGVPPESDEETFTITVGNIDRTPVLALIGDRTVDEGQALTIPISATDPDLKDVLALSAIDLPAFCTFTSSGATGSIDCSPGFDDTGDYPVTVTVEDSGELTDDETFTIRVQNVDRPPVLDPIGPQPVDEGDTLSIPVSASDPDEEPVALSASGLPGFCTFTSSGGSGSVDCSPDFEDAGSYAITITASAGFKFPLTDDETFTLTVHDINRPPVLQSIGDRNVDEAQQITIPLSASDPDIQDTVTLSATGLPGFCSLSSEGGSGSIDCAPDFRDRGSYTITVVAADNGLPTASDEETFTLTVGNINRPPTLGTIGDRTVDEGQALTIPVSASDPDAKDVLALSATGVPDFCTFISSGGAGGVQCSPGFEDAGTYPVTVTVTDSGTPPLTDGETFTLTVRNVNRAPVLGTIGNRQVDEGEQTTIGLSSSDPDLDSLTLSHSGLPGFCSFTSSGGTGSIVCAPGFLDMGNYDVTITATDDGVPTRSDTETFTLTVGDVNRAPVLASIGDREGDEGESFTIPLAAADPDTNDVLTLSAAGLPAFCSLTSSGGTGSIACSPSFGDDGSYTVEVTVTDGGQLFDSETFTIRVGGVNQAPTIAVIDDREVEEAHDLSIDVSAIDPDVGDVLTLTETGLPDFCTLSASGGSGRIDCSPQAGDAGTYAATVTATDDGTPQRSDSETFTIRVRVEDPGTRAGDDSVTTRAGESIVIRVLDNDSGPGLHVTAVSQADHGSPVVSFDGLTIIYIPDSGFTGEDSFTYTLRNDVGSTRIATVRVIVGMSGIEDLGENERAVAHVLDVACNEATGELAERCQEMQSMSDEQGRNALEEIVPEKVAAQGSNIVEVSTTQLQNVRTRIVSVRHGSTGVDVSGLSLSLRGEAFPLASFVDFLTEEPSTAPPPAAEAGDSFGERLGVFVNGRVEIGERDTTARETGQDLDTVGITSGVDYRLSDNLVLGGSLGFARTDSDFHGSGGTLETSLYTVSFFGVVYPTADKTWIDWVASYGASDFDVERRIVFSTVDTVASGSTDGDEIALSLSGGYEHRRNAWGIEPYARIDWITADIEGYTESGGAGLALIIDDQEVDSLATALAGRFTRTISRGWGVLTPGVHVEWEHEFSDDGRLITSRFAADPSAGTFAISTDDPDRDFFNVGGTLSFGFRGGTSAYVDLERVVGDAHFTRNTFSFGVRTAF